MTIRTRLAGAAAWLLITQYYPMQAQGFIDSNMEVPPFRELLGGADSTRIALRVDQVQG